MVLAQGLEDAAEVAPEAKAKDQPIAIAYVQEDLADAKAAEFSEAPPKSRTPTSESSF